MDTRQFAADLLQSLADIALFDQVALQSEGPIVNGRAFRKGSASQFLRFYYNSQTGTMAFALIENEQRVWGIDFDNRRGWHLHPMEDPATHEAIPPMPVREIIMTLAIALASRRKEQDERDEQRG